MEKELAQKIVSLIGGKENVTQVWHCATRLRMNVKDKNKVELVKIGELKGVVTAQFSSDQLQIIIGDKVNKVYEEVVNITGSLEQPSEKNKDNKNGIVTRLMETIAGIFTPILPVIAGTGLLKGLLSLAKGLGWMSVEASGYKVLFIIADAAFYFLPFLLAVSAAKMFKTNIYLAMTVAASLFYPTIVDSYNLMSAGKDVAAIKLFDVVNVPFINYSSSVIPIILGIWLLSYIEPRIKKIVPNVVSIMFSPMITLLIVIPLTLIVLGPLGNYIGQILVIAITWLFEHAGLLAGALLGVGMPLIIMTGMHYALFPVVFNNFGLLGYDTMLNPIALVTNVAQSGAAFAVAVKSKNKETKELATSSGISAMLGITEPAMYGINIKLKRPFYACLIAGGISGAIVVFFGLKSFAFLTGIISLTAYVDPSNKWNLLLAIGGFILSFVLSFILTLVLGFDDPVMEEDARTEGSNEKDVEENKKAEVTSSVQQVSSQSKTVFNAPVDGTLIDPKTLTDSVFANQIMGPSFVIKPENDKIYAPVDGEVSYIADSKHAIGIKTADGLEVLLHIGIDTVELAGKGFSMACQVGDSIKQGQLLLTIDLDAIQKKYDTSVITIITNGSHMNTQTIGKFGMMVDTTKNVYEVL